MFGWAEKKSSHVFEPNSVQKEPETQSMCFLVKQFTVCVFPSNVNYLLWISVFFMSPRMHEGVSPSGFCTVFKNSQLDQMICSADGSVCHAKVQEKQLYVTLESRYVITYLVQRKFVLRSISSMCASEHIKKLLHLSGMSPVQKPMRSQYLENTRPLE